MANSRARATTGWSAAAGSSPLHACDELAQDLARQGVDLTLLHADRVISLLAARQDAIVTWEQLGALGIGRGVIARRVQRGMLRALHVGVYLWAAPAPSFSGRSRAAVLAGGAGTAASHDASAALWEFRPQFAGPIDVTAVGRTIRARGVRGHQVTRLHPADIGAVRGSR